MKTCFFILTLLVALCLPLWGEVVWPNPVDVISFDNIEFDGTGLRTVDGNTVLFWKSGEAAHRVNYIQKFNSQMQPLWTTPIALTQYMKNVRLAETSDGNLVLFWESQTQALVTKLSTTGTFLWSANGIVIENLPSPFNGFNIEKVSADHAGGVFLTWTESLFTSMGEWVENYLKVQHLTSAGVLQMGTTGLNMTTSLRTLRSADIAVLQDNSAILSYSADSLTVINHLSPTGVSLWSQPVIRITPTTFQSNWSLSCLALVSNDAFMAVFMGPVSTAVQKYTTAGAPVWSQPVNLAGAPLVDDYSWYPPKVIVNPDNSLIVSWLCLHQIINQKISSGGQLLWGANGVTYNLTTFNSNNYKWDICTDGAGGSYVLSLDRGNDYGNPIRNWYNMQHINSQGLMLSQPTQISSGNYSSYHSMGHFITPANNNAIVNWLEYRGQNCSIYAQCINQQGEKLFAADDIAIETGSYGNAINPQMVSDGEHIITFWQQKDFFSYNYSNLKHQIVNSDGTLALPEGGLPLITTPNHEIMSYQTVSSPEGTLIYWKERVNNSSGMRYRAQLLDNSHNPVWEGAGKTICQDTSGDIKSVVSYDEGAFYFVWTARLASSGNRTRLLGQKYVGGTAQWSLPGLQLAADNPDYLQKNDYLFGLEKKYLIIGHGVYDTGGSDGKVYVLRFDSNGQAVAGFNAYGNQISSMPEGICGQSAVEWTLWNDDLVISFGQWYQEWNETLGYYEYRQSPMDLSQKMSSTGSILWGEAGIDRSYHHFRNLVVLGNRLYSTMTNAHNMHRYNSDGSEDDLFIFNQIPEINAFNVLPLNNCLVFIANTYTPVQFVYWFFDPSVDEYCLPAGNQLEQSTSGMQFLTCKMGGQAAVLWSDYTYPNADEASWKMQLINSTGVDVEDDTTPSAMFDLSANYPNPFSQNTTISCTLKADSECELSVYNLKGQLVKILSKGLLTKGINHSTWDGKDRIGTPVANGMYFYRLSDGSRTQTKKMCLIK